MHGATAPSPFFKTCSTAGAVSHPPVHMYIYIGIYMQMHTHMHIYIYTHIPLLVKKHIFSIEWHVPILILTHLMGVVWFKPSRPREMWVICCMNSAFGGTGPVLKHEDGSLVARTMGFNSECIGMLTNNHFCIPHRQLQHPFAANLSNYLGERRVPKQTVASSWSFNRRARSSWKKQ